jgi:hypothetical protein
MRRMTIPTVKEIPMNAVRMWRIVVILAAAILGAAAAPAFADPAADRSAIEAVMRGTWDRPDARLGVDPVVIVADHAIAGWIQGDMGGRALLRKRDGAWSVVLCSGDGIRSADAMRHAGLSATDAERLAQQLAEAERRLPAATLALFAKFEGTLLMDASGAHPPAAHGAHKH